MYPVCSKPNCTHSENDDCEAIFANNDGSSIQWVSQNIYYYRGYCYIISNDTGDIIKLSTDGHEKTVLVKNAFSSGDTTGGLVGQCLTFSGDYVYAYNMNEHFVTDGTYTEKITRYNLSDGDAKVIYEYEGEKSAICAVKVYGDQLFFTIQEFKQMEQNGVSLWTRSSIGLYGYDLNTGNTGLLMDESVTDYTVDVNTGCIYAVVNNYGIIKYDCKTDEKSQIIDFNDYEQLYSCNVSCDGNYLYIDNAWSQTYVKALGQNFTCKTYVFDTDGTCLKAIERTSSEYPLFGDENYIFDLAVKDGAACLAFIDKSKDITEWGWEYEIIK